MLTRPDTDPEKIGVVGHSMGAATAIMSAAQIPEIRMVIAESAYTSIEDNIAQGIRSLTNLPPFPFAPFIVWFAESQTGSQISRVRPIDVVAGISPRPIMFIHGALDDTIPVINSYELYARAEEPKALFILPNAGHGGLYQADSQKFEREVLFFMKMNEITPQNLVPTNP